MENATKALIIAGAILVSILLISVGIIVYQSATGVINQGGTQMDAEEIRIFNEKFTSSAGPNKKAIEVRNVIEGIVASNATHESDNEKVTLDFCGKEYKGNEISGVLGEVSPKLKYTIKAETADSGLVNKVVITTP